MKIGLLLDPGRTHWIRGFTASGRPGFRGNCVRTPALEPGFHRVRAHWIRGFMTFQRAWPTRSVMLMVPA
jgi:hypothetical protein